MDPNIPDVTLDDELLHRIGRMLAAADPAPQRLREIGCELLAWRDADVELAELLGASVSRGPTAAE